MTNELINAIISAITGAFAGGIVTLFLDKRKEQREDKKEKEREKKKIYDRRPELEIVDYKEYLKRPGHKVKKECDINVFITKMEDVSVEGDAVIAHYNKDFFNEDEWCCVIYEFKNVGKTDILCISPICTYQKDTMLCEVNSTQMILEHGVLNYSTLFDRKIRVGQCFTMKVCYHKECVVTGMFSAIMIMAIEDSNKRYWKQSLFAPSDKIYDSSRITYKEYRNEFMSDMAIECFKKPWLW